MGGRQFWTSQVGLTPNFLRDRRQSAYSSLPSVLVTRQRRLLITTVTSIVSGTTAYALSIWAGAAVFTWAFLLGIMVQGLALGVPAVDHVRLERKHEREEQERAQEEKERTQEYLAERIKIRVALNDALDPIVGQIAQIAAAGSRREKRPLQDQILPMILNSASGVIGPARARSCWFELEDGSPCRLVPKLHAGRAGPPSTVFVEGTQEGDAVFRILKSNQHRICEDLARDPPVGFDRTRSRDYRTFIAVPVVAGTTLFGMLTVDALLPGDLTEDDAALLRIFAGLLAAARAGD
jgi:GAF domain-containing protein